ncbi:MAG: tetratricopeptide repeat protein [Armatimonadota bacterium]
MGIMAELGSAMALVCIIGLAAIIAGLGLHRIIGWYIEGSISGAACILIAGIYAGAIISAIIARTMVMAITILILIALISILIPILSGKMDRASLKSLNDEKICRYREAIEANPENLAARSMLAKTLHSDGRLDEAIEVMEELVRRTPNDYVEAGFLKKLTKERDERNSLRRHSNKGA